MYLALEPAGAGQLDPDKEIPVERTSSPYDVVEAFSGLAETTDQIDTDQLAGSLTTLADLTRNTPEEFKAALSGVSPALGEHRRARTSGSTCCSPTCSGSPRSSTSATRTSSR